MENSMNRRLFAAACALIAAPGISSAKSLAGAAVTIEGTGVIESLLDGAIDVIAGPQSSMAENSEFGETCAMWLETDPDVPLLRLTQSNWSNADTWLDLHMDEVEGQYSDEPLPFQRSLLAQVSHPGDAASGGRHEFLTETGYHLVIDDVLLTWDMGEQPGCYGRATIVSRQR
jgi:hypothetical protein